MGRNSSPVHPRGEAIPNAEVVRQKSAGQLCVHIDEDGQEVVMRVVKNASGGALTPRQTVKYDLDAIGTQIDGVATATTRPAGVVDSELPASGVANGEWFLIAVEGVHDVLAHGALTIGDDLVSAAAGRVDTSGATPTFFYIGRAIEAAAAQDDNTKALLAVKG